MKTYNKEFQYNGYNFNVKVELGTSAERHIGGKVFNTITVNDMGFGNYYKKQEVEDSLTQATIEVMITAAKKSTILQDEPSTALELWLTSYRFKK